MSRYRIELRPAAERALRKLDNHTEQRVRGAITLLAANPRPAAARPLTNRPEWRLRVGDYRVLYDIQDNVLVIIVLTLGHRREVYRG